MSDTSWDDYTAEEPIVADTAGLEQLAGDVAPVVYAAEIDSWQGDNASSWGDWNAETANVAATDAAAELEYAQEAYAGGYTEAGDAAVARAEYYTDLSEKYDGTAADYYGTAASEYGAAAEGYETAAGYVQDYADTTSYDTTSYDTTSYDTTSYDTTSYDTTSYDTTSYDTTSYDTTSYDATSYDATSYDTTSYDTTSYDTGDAGV